MATASRLAIKKRKTVVSLKNEEKFNYCYWLEIRKARLDYQESLFFLIYYLFGYFICRLVFRPRNPSHKTKNQELVQNKKPGARMKTYHKEQDSQAKSQIKNKIYKISFSRVRKTKGTVFVIRPLLFFLLYLSHLCNLVFHHKKLTKRKGLR